MFRWLRSAEGLQIQVGFTVSVDANATEALKADLRQAFEDLGIQGQLSIEEE